LKEASYLRRRQHRRFRGNSNNHLQLFFPAINLAFYAPAALRKDYPRAGHAEMSQE